MLLVWIGFIVEVMFFNVLKSFIHDTEVVAIYLISINILILLIAIGKYKKGLREIIFSAYSLRIAAMFWDVYGRNIYPLPHSGNDSEGFLYTATLVANDLSLIKGDIYGDIYTKILGVLFYLTSTERLIGQYLNVLLGISTIVIIYRILSLLEINEKTTMLSIILISFFPHGIIFSAILLRENFITMFVSVSLYYFIKWCRQGKFIFSILSFLNLAAASLFHSGVIGIAVGYIFIYMFYDRKTDKLSFKLKTVLVFIAIILSGVLVFTQLSDVFLGKFDNIDSLNDVVSATEGRAGGSSYLVGFKANSSWQLIYVAPVMMFYFLVSPLPMNWRGINDIISFFADSIIYFILLVYSIRNGRKYIGKSPILIGILIMILVVVFIFGIGVQNAGTALRHRHKIFNIIVVFFALIHDLTEKENMNQIYRNL